MELSRGCSRMHLLMAVSSCHTCIVAALPLQRVYRRKQGSKKQCTIALHQLFPCSSPMCRQGSTGKRFDLLLNSAAPTPKPAPHSPPSQPGLRRPGCRSQPSSGACPVSWSHLLGTTSLLLMGSQCAGTGIIGLLTLGHNHVLQSKQKKIENKYSIIMIVSGDRGNNHSKRSLLWGRGGFLSRAGLLSCAGCSPRGLDSAFYQGTAGELRRGCLCARLSGYREVVPAPGLATFKHETKE